MDIAQRRRAIDAAFEAQVALLFKNCCDGLTDDGAEKTTARFGRGLEIAEKVHGLAIKKFVEG